MQSIGIVGVGLLGSAVASRLLAGGFSVTGYDVVPELTATLEPKGLRAAGSIAEAAAGAEAVFTVLPSLEVVEEAYLGPDGLVAQAAAGTILLQMSTISPALTRRLAEGVLAGGKRFLDTPISGTSGMVAVGDATILVAGDDAAVRQCQPLFDAIGHRTVTFGEPGSAMLAKLATNLLVALNSVVMAEALVLASKGGIEPAKMLDMLRQSAGASKMMDIRGPMMVAGEYPAQMKLKLFLKDMRLMLEAADELGVALPITKAGDELMRQTSEDGAAMEDMAAVMRQLERMAGIER
ncbi:MAG: NAD(P)-dependent oxidoreductase [bacterium]